MLTTTTSPELAPVECSGPGCDCYIHDRVALLLGISSTTGRSIEQLRRQQSSGYREVTTSEYDSKMDELRTKRAERELREARREAEQEVLRSKLLADDAAREGRANKLMLSLYEAGMVDRRQVVETATLEATETQKLIKSLQNRALDYDKKIKKVRDLQQGGIVPTPTPIPKGYGERWNDVCRDCHGNCNEHVEVETFGKYETELACTRPPIGTERVRR